MAVPKSRKTNSNSKKVLKKFFLKKKASNYSICMNCKNLAKNYLLIKKRVHLQKNYKSCVCTQIKQNVGASKFMLERNYFFTYILENKKLNYKQ